ncbi:MAG: hypothetical protein AB7G28_19685 [Pirellulales bacterium]
MAHANCKRIWEGTLGIAMSPRKKRSGEYFWSFSFVRAFRRTRNSNWEYVQQFGQQHAVALGLLMSRAFHFMEQNDPAQFLEAAMEETTGNGHRTDTTPSTETDSENHLPPDRAAG